ncbi:MAG: response regulator [Gammaproteobacteria bacterium]|nr:response regulator [Gammaproteobacteria bacterium]MDH5728208.1 response regulator [Gammaproteobacteria bacterium]
MAKILVVDDVPVVCEFISLALTEAGHGVDMASGGREAMEKIKSNHYDLLITDLLMPDMDGFELVSAAKKQLKQLKIIAISAGGAISSDVYLDMADDRLQLDGRLPKPIEVDDLIELTERVLTK